MIPKSERLSVLSDAEYEALYGLPDFDDGQQLDYLSLNESELAFAMSRPDTPTQVHCILQIGYFKAKQAFFRFTWDDIEDDVNFAIMYCFGPRFEPRFTNLDDQLKELYCADDPALYEKCLIRPVGQADLPAIVDEKPNLGRIMATLGLKEMTQGTLIRKLCKYTSPNTTRRTLFELDKLVRSIYLLRYLRDPQLERNVHRSQNRIESYHQLRSAIAQVGGKKELTGRTDIEIEISNQCARLIANAIIYYNSAILSRLLTKYEAAGSAKALAFIKQISPTAWRHILLNGHYTFHTDGKAIDLDATIAGLGLE